VKEEVTIVRLTETSFVVEIQAPEIGDPVLKAKLQAYYEKWIKELTEQAIYGGPKPDRLDSVFEGFPRRGADAERSGPFPGIVSFHTPC
jgi:hypothetical protein